jgi:hypothetical protein
VPKPGLYPEVYVIFSSNGVMTNHKRNYTSSCHQASRWTMQLWGHAQPLTLCPLCVPDMLCSLNLVPAASSGGRKGEHEALLHPSSCISCVPGVTSTTMLCAPPSCLVVPSSQPLCMCCRCLQVALPQDFVPTPFVAAGVALLGCSAGIMVTASHNTKEYNGYKVRGLLVVWWFCAEVW